MRLPDWQKRLADFLKKRKAEDFRWGSHDCCLFACDAIKEIAGIDPGEVFRGQYDTKESAFAFIDEFCAIHAVDGSVEHGAEILTARYGFIEVEPNFAQRGDLAYIRRTMLGEALGIHLGTQIAFVSEKRGLLYLPLNIIDRTWRIA